MGQTTLKLSRRQMELFEAHLVWAEGVGRRLCTAHLPPCFEAADLIQAARVGLAKAAKKFDPTVGTPFMGFAHIYVQNECFMFVRRRGYESAKYEELPVAVEGPAAKRPDAQVEAELESAHIRQEMKGLAPEQRRVLDALFWEGVSLTCLARKLHRSAAEVARLRDEAFQMMRERL